MRLICGRPKGSKNKSKKELKVFGESMSERCHVFSREELRKRRMARLNEEEKKRIETMASSFMNEPNLTWKE